MVNFIDQRKLLRWARSASAFRHQTMVRFIKRVPQFTVTPAPAIWLGFALLRCAGTDGKIYSPSCASYSSTISARGNEDVFSRYVDFVPVVAVVDPKRLTCRYDWH